MTLSDSLLEFSNESDTKEYIMISKRLSVYKSNMDGLIKRLVDYLEPNPNIRVRMNASAKFKQLSGKRSYALYPHPEFQLANSFAKFSSEFLEPIEFSNALKLTAEAYKMIALAKTEEVARAKHIFVNSLHMFVEQNVRLSLDEHQKLEKVFRNYDSKRRTLDKNKAIVNPALESAREEFKVKSLSSMETMRQIRDCEYEQLQHLNKFVLHQLCYHKAAKQAFVDLLKKIPNREKYSEEAESQA